MKPEYRKTLETIVNNDGECLVCFESYCPFYDEDNQCSMPIENISPHNFVQICKKLLKAE